MEEKNTILNASIYACILIPETLICEKAWILESKKYGVLYGPVRNFSQKFTGMRNTDVQQATSRRRQNGEAIMKKIGYPFFAIIYNTDIGEVQNSFLFFFASYFHSTHIHIFSYVILLCFTCTSRKSLAYHDVCRIGNNFKMSYFICMKK